jgi:hypothetical protein
MFNIKSYSYVIANYAECGFDGGDEKSLPISYYIVESAGYFLKSHSDIILFLNRVEMSEINGIDYKELRNILYRAIENMEKAKEEYYILKQKTDATPYNQLMINYLLSFNYNRFLNERGLISDIFKLVETFLGTGNVRGVFDLLLKNTENILDKLYSLKESVDADTFPNILILWRVNQDYIETILFGQYTSEVLKSILFEDKNACI